MARTIDLVINTEKNTDQKLYPLASGHISQTVVRFEKENLVAVIQAKGSVEFYDADDVRIAAGSVAAEDGGRQVYEEFRCKKEGALLQLQFPVCEWIDNYPHCDGEHDRWDTRIVGWRTLTLDLSTGTIL